MIMVWYLLGLVSYPFIRYVVLFYASMFGTDDMTEWKWFP